MTEWNYCPVCADTLKPDGANRPSCPRNHFTKYPTPVAATLAFIHNNGKYLILRRSHEPQKGKWDLPGGFVEPKETAYETLIREIEEETQLRDLQFVELLGTFPSTYGGVEDTLAVGYLLNSDDTNVTLSDENDDYKWVSLREIPELAFEDCRAALILLKESLR